MKHALVLLLMALAGVSDASAQCLCGSIDFTFVDPSSDTPILPMPVGADSSGAEAEPMYRISFEALEPIAPVTISRRADSSASIHLPTYAGFNVLVLHLTRGEEAMTIEISSVEQEQIYRLDSIPYRPGLYRLDLRTARSDGKGSLGFDSIGRHLVLMRKLQRLPGEFSPERKQ